MSLFFWYLKYSQTGLIKIFWCWSPTASREITRLIWGLMDISFIIRTCLVSEHYPVGHLPSAPSLRLGILNWPVWASGHHNSVFLLSLPCLFELELWVSLKVKASALWFSSSCVNWLDSWGYSTHPLCGSPADSPTSAQRLQFQLSTGHVLELNLSHLPQDHPLASMPSLFHLVSLSLSASSSPSCNKHFQVYLSLKENNPKEPQVVSALAPLNVSPPLHC